MLLHKDTENSLVYSLLSILRRTVAPFRSAVKGGFSLDKLMSIQPIKDQCSNTLQTTRHAQAEQKGYSFHFEQPYTPQHN